MSTPIELKSEPTLRTESDYPFCPGCGHGPVLDALNAALVKLELEAHEVVIVSDIGCSGLSDQYFTTSAFHGLHGRSITYATGIKLMRPDLTVVVIMTPLVLVYELESLARLPAFTPSTWIGLLLLAFFHNYLSNILFLRALQHLDAIQTALCNYLITFFGVPIAAIWLGERLTPTAVAGGLLVLVGTILVTIGEAQHDAKEAAEAELR